MGKSVIHPGVYLREDYLPLKYKGNLIDMLESLSSDSGIDIRELENIIHEKYSIDKNVSTILGNIFDIHEDCFYNLQKKYEKNLLKSIQIIENESAKISNEFGINGLGHKGGKLGVIHD